MAPLSYRPILVKAQLCFFGYFDNTFGFPFLETTRADYGRIMCTFWGLIIGVFWLESFGFKFKPLNCSTAKRPLDS